MVTAYDVLNNKTSLELYFSKKYVKHKNHSKESSIAKEPRLQKLAITFLEISKEQKLALKPTVFRNLSSFLLSLHQQLTSFTFQKNLSLKSSNSRQAEIIRAPDLSKKARKQDTNGGFFTLMYNMLASSVKLVTQQKAKPSGQPEIRVLRSKKSEAFGEQASLNGSGRFLRKRSGRRSPGSSNRLLKKRSSRLEKLDPPKLCLEAKNLDVYFVLFDFGELQKEPSKRICSKKAGYELARRWPRRRRRAVGSTGLSSNVEYVLFLLRHIVFGRQVLVGSKCRFLPS